MAPEKVGRNFCGIIIAQHRQCIFFADSTGRPGMRGAYSVVSGERDRIKNRDQPWHCLTINVQELPVQNKSLHHTPPCAGESVWRIHIHQAIP